MSCPTARRLSNISSRRITHFGDAPRPCESSDHPTSRRRTANRPQPPADTVGEIVPKPLRSDVEDSREGHTLTTPRPRSGAPALLAICLMLTACAAEDDPTPIFAEPTAPPDVTTTAQPEKETVEQFLDRWAEEGREMQNSGETASYRALTDDCEPCTSFADQVDEFYSAGGFIETEGQRITAVERDGKTNLAVAYNVRAETSPTEYRESSDTQNETLAGGTVLYRIHLKRENNDWRFLNYVLVAQ